MIDDAADNGDAWALGVIDIGRDALGDGDEGGRR